MIKKIVLIIIVVAVSATGIYYGFLREEESLFVLTQVTREDISQNVSSVGMVKKGNKIDLSFERLGKIEEISVKLGRKVERGETVAKLDSQELRIQLQESRANLNVAQAKLDKLIAGATEQEIQTAQTKVENARVTLQNAQKNLENVRQTADQNLESTYQEAQNTLSDSYLKAYNTFNIVNSIQRTYFYGRDQQSIKVKSAVSRIENSKNQIKSALDSAKDSSSFSDTDLALSQTEENLDKIYEALGEIREICEDPVYRNMVSSTDKSSIDTQKGYINTALTNISSAQTSVSSTELTNQSNIDTAQASVSEARGKLQAAEDSLAQLTAPPQQEEVQLYQSQVEQAQAKVNLLENQIKNSVLSAPTNGEVVAINSEVGEQISSTQPVISLLPETPFQIEVNIAETDIGNVEVGDPCEISLDAFPELEFSGQVIEIDPSETLISGVVYYQARVSSEFGGLSKGKVKPGMTAEVNIICESKQDILAVPQRAVIEEEGKKMVRIPLNNTEYEKKEVEIGLKGSEGKVEIISGLQEGEQVIRYIRNSD